MKDAYLKFMLATVIYGTNGIVASHIPLCRAYPCDRYRRSFYRCRFVGCYP